MSGRIEHLDRPWGPLPVYTARPDGQGPVPGVVVLHDALGMTDDLRRQADWLSGAGFLAAAPDLYRGDRRLRCVASVIRDAARGSGAAFDDVEAVRRHLADRPSCTGSIGVIGFCLGGGFALLLAPTGGYRAASVNYGALPKDPVRFLRNSCPIVASYGADDWTLRNAGPKLASALRSSGVANDVKTYPGAGHAFLNDHVDADVPRSVRVLSWASRSRYDEASAQDARRRIVAFFRTHLVGEPPGHRPEPGPEPDVC